MAVGRLDERQMFHTESRFPGAMPIPIGELPAHFYVIPDPV